MKNPHQLTKLAIFLLPIIFLSLALSLQNRYYNTQVNDLQNHISQLNANLTGKDDQITEVSRQLFACNQGYALELTPESRHKYPPDFPIKSQYLDDQTVVHQQYIYRDQQISDLFKGDITASNDLSYSITVTKLPSDSFMLGVMVDGSLIPSNLQPKSSLISNHMLTVKLDPLSYLRQHQPRFTTKNYLTFYATQRSFPHYSYQAFVSPSPAEHYSIKISWQPPNSDEQPSLVEIDRGFKEVGNSFAIN